jgi:hypothetical protein
MWKRFWKEKEKDIKRKTKKNWKDKEKLERKSYIVENRDRLCKRCEQVSIKEEKTCWNNKTREKPPEER